MAMQVRNGFSYVSDAESRILELERLSFKMRNRTFKASPGALVMSSNRSSQSNTPPFACLPYNFPVSSSFSRIKTSSPRRSLTRYRDASG